MIPCYFLNVCVCLYACVHVYVLVYVCVCVGVFVRACIHACVCACVRACVASALTVKRRLLPLSAVCPGNIEDEEECFMYVKYLFNIAGFYSICGRYCLILYELVCVAQRYETESTSNEELK